jgi:putative tryptophan/tyrosine transport system permease protein
VLEIVESGLRQGLLLVPLAAGIHIAFRFAHFPDLTPDGSILLGSSLSSIMLLNGWTPVLALAAGMLGGGTMGCITAFLSEFVGLDRILAGIATSLLAYTMTLRILGSGNVALPVDSITVFGSAVPDFLVMALSAAATLLAVALYARSRFGLRLRAVGENEQLSEQLGGRVGVRISLGLFWANACVALTGGLLAQYQRFSDVGQGAGTLFVGLACILIGGALPTGGRLIPRIGASALGAVVYACLIAASLRVGLRPGDLKAVTAILVIVTAWLGNRFLPAAERSPLFE